MFELYHWEPTSNSAEPIILLKEKGVDYVSHYVDVAAFEHLSPEFLKINPRAQVPLLVHDGKVLTETGFILQYIEATFHRPSFTPHDAKGRYWTNVWIKYVNEYLAVAAWKLGVARGGTAGIDVGRARDALRHAPFERQQAWAKVLDSGFSADELEIARLLLPTRLERMEAALAEGDWLAGEHYSIADIVVFPTALALAGILPDMIGPASTPRIMAWLERMQARPAVRETLAEARSPNPQALFVPGPEGSRWG